MKPSVGRIVYCMTADKVVSSAIVTKVYDDERGPNGNPVVNVYLFRDEPTTAPERISHIYMVAGPHEAEPGTWFWPERV